MHARKQIRDHIAAALDGLATTADRVYVGRERALPADHDPVLLVYLREETSARSAHGRPPLEQRAVTLHIEGRVQTVEPPDDLLDQIGSEVETRMGAEIDYATGKIMGGLALNLQLTATQHIAAAVTNSHKLMGGIRLDYLVTYRTQFGAPDTVV